MRNENHEKTVAVVIAKNAYRQLESESRKRRLSPGECLEMLIEMDYICNNGGEEPEEGAVSVIGKSDFRSLRWFGDNIAGNRPFTGVVLYSGTLAGSMGKGLWAVPFGTLWARR